MLNCTSYYSNTDERQNLLPPRFHPHGITFSFFELPFLNFAFHPGKKIDFSMAAKLRLSSHCQNFGSQSSPNFWVPSILKEGALLVKSALHFTLFLNTFTQNFGNAGALVARHRQHKNKTQQDHETSFQNH